MSVIEYVNAKTPLAVRKRKLDKIIFGYAYMYRKMAEAYQNSHLSSSKMLHFHKSKQHPLQQQQTRLCPH